MLLLPLANQGAHVLLLPCVCLLPVLLQAATVMQADRPADTAPLSGRSRQVHGVNLGRGHGHHGHGHGRGHHHQTRRSSRSRLNLRPGRGVASSSAGVSPQQPQLLDPIRPGHRRQKLSSQKRNTPFRDVLRDPSSSQESIISAALGSMFDDVKVDSQERQRKSDVPQQDSRPVEDVQVGNGNTRNGEQQEAGTRRHLIPCPGCQRAVSDANQQQQQQQQLSQTEMKELLIERIKQQILLKLRLPSTPNITRRYSRLPEPLSRNNRMMGDQAVGLVPHETKDQGMDEFYGKTTEVVTFGTEVQNCRSSRPAGCFHFDLQGNLNADDVTSAELWVYKLPDDGDRRKQTLVFSELMGPGYNTSQRSQELGHKYVSGKKRWVRFNIRSAVQRWLDDPKRNFGLLVSCKTCHRHVSSSPIGADDDLKPFIVVQMTDHHRRFRRTTNDCADRTDNHCCREHLYLNFAEIGWDHWITYPEGYTANYCKGVCYGPLPISPRYHHSTIMQEVANTRRKEELAPCCAPRHMSSISLLYFIDNGKIIRKTLPNMVVESCGCT